MLFMALDSGHKENKVGRQNLAGRIPGSKGKAACWLVAGEDSGNLFKLRVKPIFWLMCMYACMCDFSIWPNTQI